MLKKDITKQKLKAMLENYLHEHQEYYTDAEKKYIMENFSSGLFTDFSDALLRQIYSELSLIDDEHNIYLGFTNLIEREFGLDKHILEVGGGKIPCLGKNIALRQKSGTITIYDPGLITTTSPYKNLNLKKKNFTTQLIIPKPDLIIGFTPTTATDQILEYAFATNTDFMIALSDIFDEVDFYQEEDDIWTHWQKEKIYEARKLVAKNNMGKLMIETLEKYDNPYPIIYNKRKR